MSYSHMLLDWQDTLNVFRFVYFISSMNVLLECVSVYHALAKYTRRSEEGV